MDKPRSLSVKDYLVRVLSVKLMIPESTIDAVVSHQFSSANAALNGNDVVEVTGFGKFYFNKKKAQKKLMSLLKTMRIAEDGLKNEEITEKRKNTLIKTYNYAKGEYEKLNSKLNINEPVANLRGVEEQLDSSQAPEADCEGDSREENEHLLSVSV